MRRVIKGDESAVHGSVEPWRYGVRSATTSLVRLGLHEHAENLSSTRDATEALDAIAKAEAVVQGVYDYTRAFGPARAVDGALAFSVMQTLAKAGDACLRASLDQADKEEVECSILQ